MPYTDFIKQSLAAAAELANAQFGKVSGTTKPGDNNQVLTETDIAIGKLLIERITQHFPNHNIIDEEAGVIDKGSNLTWVIDPIDGTSNFANGIPTYGVMLGLLEAATPIAGGIALPFFNEVITAEKGQGTWLNGERLSVTKEPNLNQVLVAYCIDGHPEAPEVTHHEMKMMGELILNIRNLRTSGSAFDVSLLVQGKYGAILNRTSKIWDNVAPQILIEEAGGIYTDFFGQAVDYSQPLIRASQNFTCCTASQTLHTQIQEILKPFAQ